MVRHLSNLVQARALLLVAGLILLCSCNSEEGGETEAEADIQLHLQEARSGGEDLVGSFRPPDVSTQMDVTSPADMVALEDIPEELPFVSDLQDSTTQAEVRVELDVVTPEDTSPDLGEAAADITDLQPEVSGPPPLGPAGQFSLGMNVDGVNRTYQLFVPQSALQAMAAGPVPMLFAYHGAGDSAANFIAATELTGAASSNAFVLAAGDGYNAGWFVQYEEGWPGTDGNESSLQNDAEMTLRILDEVGEEYWIDTKRVYAVGHSRGAGLAGLLAMLSGGMGLSSGTWISPFAAYGINAGYDAAGGSISAGLAFPKRPIWEIHGTADGVVPYSYGAGFAAALEAAGWTVTFTSVQGAGHKWLWRPQYGQTNQDLWSFFLANAIQD